MDDLRLFKSNRKLSEEQPSDEPREYIVYFFFFIAVTAVIAIFARWSANGIGWGIGTAALVAIYFADRLITTFRRRQ
jgi:hypothetical protein